MNGAVSKVNKKFISHLTQTQRTLSAVYQLLQKFPTFHRTKILYTFFTITCSLSLILILVITLHDLLFYFFKIPF
jgi:hypothetical protein